MQYAVVLSYVQANVLLTAREQQETISKVSPDLGISTVVVELRDDGAHFPDGERLSWLDLEKIKKASSTCFEVVGNTIVPIQYFSEFTNRMCTLCPTLQTPTMVIAGFTMHRIVDIDPMEDTRKKMETLTPVLGRVLDTATGLGYTAISAARTALDVTTIELDPGAQEIAKRNPWSRELFTRTNITQLIGDAFEVVPTFADETFERIVHDPPVFSLAGDLYAGSFYRQLYRVLKRNGRLFHYIGNLESRSSGTVMKGALKRLQEAGFKKIVRRPEAFGVLAYK